MPLTAIDPLWINARNGAPEYDAEELRRNLGYLLAPGDNAGVSRSGVLDLRGLLPYLSGSDVWVPPGGAIVGTSKGAYVTGNRVAAKIDALAPADATNPRRDRIVLVILDPDNGAPRGAVPRAEFRVITGTPSATAQTGGGYPPAPSGVAGALTLGWVDVPKVGAGAPAVTDQRIFTSSVGGLVPVRGAAEMAALPGSSGVAARRLDLGGAIFTYDGTHWLRGVQHAEWTARTDPIANRLWGPGPLTKDAGRCYGDSGLESPGDDLIRLPEVGLYAIHITLRLSGKAWGETWGALRTEDENPAALEEFANVDIPPGNAAGVVSAPNFFAWQPMTLRIRFRTDASGLTLDSRVRVSRLG